MKTKYLISYNRKGDTSSIISDLLKFGISSYQISARIGIIHIPKDLKKEEINNLKKLHWVKHVEKNITHYAI